MRRFLVTLVSAGVLTGVYVAPAGAADTRAEYIGLVDPICQSFVPSENAAYRAYNKNAKRWDHFASHGTLKAWLNAARRTSHSLTRFTQIDTSLNDQIAAVPPPQPDAGIVNAWLTYRRAANTFTASAAVALNKPIPQVDKYFKRVRQANEAFDGAQKVIAGFGFQVCQVSV